MSLERPEAQHPYDKLPALPGFSLSSADFTEGDALPVELSQDGENRSPQLSWSGFPAETKGFVLSCFDPDAPTPSGFWHWTVVDLSADVTSLEAGEGESDLMLPGAAFHLRNDGGAHSYVGSAPPQGDRAHRYVFAVHALDTETLELSEDDTPAKAHFLCAFHSIARATLTGTFQR
ncbi:YbhB/YbcL family Raf kinase inhibitor-like protein [Bogoriella caseilytica]|uniref:PBP family phospholipid-binding protein n=1 Tax=Bogoriella caseilytica TaxID=56055 RepID=A0A3N2BG82_9MICO|nr:YbhB/YbcL family Raf kinase inhibitor-like protein [Bogoriella caseilytica]ROR74273.1 hypothetical protein EDD31_2677 [Bogoriella caseilytica]